MTKNLKKEIIETVAKDHHVIIDENDPIFALITANEIALKDYIKRIDQANSINLIELENQYIKITSEIKELAEKRIGIAIENTKKDLEETRVKILKDIKSTISQSTFSNSPEEKIKEKNYTKIYYFITAAVALTIGLNIGISLT